MSLPNEDVLDLLRSDFVVGWSNIQKQSHVGLSHGYRCDQTAVGTTNGAGGRNVQMVVLAPDLTVLHVIPGFWHPADLVRELRFARTVHRLWGEPDLDRAQKVRMFELMHAAHVRRFSADTIARSDWQGFDRNVEIDRYRKEPRDTVVLDGEGRPDLKAVCVLVHDRMRQRPFVRLDEFDMESFVDYGRPFYDNNEWIDKGRKFSAAQRANAAREKQQLAAERALQRGQR